MPGADVILEVRALTRRFGGLVANSNVALGVRRGEILGLIGPNGAGKTTCFNLITGFYVPDAGSVEFRGEKVTALQPFEMARRGIVRSFQKTNVLKSLSVFENVLAGHFLASRQSLWSTFFPTAKVRQAERSVRASAAGIVEEIGLAKRMNAPAHLLSCGELRLLEVAVALAAKPELLMLDEPAAGLNSHEAAEFGHKLKALRGSRVRSILLVEHNMALVMAVSDRIVVMNFGAKLAEGLPREVHADPRVIEAYLGAEKPKRKRAEVAA